LKIVFSKVILGFQLGPDFGPDPHFFEQTSPDLVWFEPLKPGLTILSIVYQQKRSKQSNIDATDIMNVLIPKRSKFAGM
jgi:hypothetical protein